MHALRISSIEPETKEALKAWRLRLGLTQTQAGMLVRAGLRTWQDWEHGKREPHPMLWLLLAYIERDLTQPAPQCDIALASPGPDSPPPAALASAPDSGQASGAHNQTICGE